MATTEMEQLKSQLKETEEQLHKAAEAGLNLLNQQLELQTKLDEQRIEMTNALEVLEQDKYSLQKDVELKLRMLDSLQADFDCCKEQQTLQLEQQAEDLERSHNKIQSELQHKIFGLQSALEESQLNEKQLNHKLEQMSEKLEKNMSELKTLNDQTHCFMTSEMMELQLKIGELENIKVEQERAYQESVYKEEQMELSVSRLRRELRQVIAEKEEREKEAASWSNALEKSRKQNQELQMELDQVVQQAQDPNSRGNSLFAELEDKRADMERQLIGMKVQHLSLQKSHAFSKQQLQRMKIQIATLMQLQGSRADPAQVERLQSMLSEKNGEIQNLTAKVQELQKAEMLRKSQPAKSNQEARLDEQDETYYIDLLKMQLRNALKDAQRLADELSMQRMKSLSESQRALELERKLFMSERQLKQAQSDKIKLQLRVEELQHKYEAKETKNNPLKKRKREKLPVDNKPSSEETTNEAEKAVQESTAAEDENTFKAPEYSVSLELKSPEKPVVISNPNTMCVLMSTASSLTVTQKEEEEQPRPKERKKKQKQVNLIHVSSNNTMENQCAQQ